MGIPIQEVSYNWHGTLSRRTKTQYIILHHVAASDRTPQEIHQEHLARGWAGIGYHYLISKNGTIYHGRPRDVIGAHCEGHNSESVGISAVGNYETEQMPPIQWKAILDLVNELKAVYPGAKVVGHKELYATACPGRNYPLEQLKAGIGPKEIIEEVLGMFKDVADGYWAKGSIERLAKMGLLAGDNQGNFNPEKPITRAEVAAVLDRLLQMFGK